MCLFDVANFYVNADIKPARFCAHTHTHTHARAHTHTLTKDPFEIKSFDLLFNSGAM